jgi:hypothetical protein
MEKELQAPEFEIQKDSLPSSSSYSATSSTTTTTAASVSPGIPVAVTIVDLTNKIVVTDKMFGLILTGFFVGGVILGVYYLAPKIHKWIEPCLEEMGGEGTGSDLAHSPLES